MELEAGTAGWLPAQQHAGHNTGDTETHVLFVELKDGAREAVTGLGPADLAPGS
jgi:beta-alanine degradation protein BauB